MKMKQVRGASLKHAVVTIVPLVIKIRDEDINVEEKISENGALMNISK